MEFFAPDWKRLGTKIDLSHAIEARTGVPRDILTSGLFRNACLAQRLSWAAGRSTKRVEDVAYCLLGLLDVNIPILYGEGDRAFLRLQEEVIRASDDVSIFCWIDSEASFSTYRGLLAASPAEFAACKDVGWTRIGGAPSYRMTNKGVKLKWDLRVRKHKLSDEYIAVLSGVKHESSPQTALGTYLRKVAGDELARVEPKQLAMLPADWQSLTPTASNPTTPFFIRQNTWFQKKGHSRAAGILIRTDTSKILVNDVQPSACWNSSRDMITFDAPLHDRKPSPAKIYLQCITHLDSITVEIDVSKPWGKFISLPANLRYQRQSPRGRACYTYQTPVEANDRACGGAGVD